MSSQGVTEYIDRQYSNPDNAFIVRALASKDRDQKHGIDENDNRYTKHIEIERKDTGEILFEGEYESIREALEDAVRRKVDLSGAIIGNPVWWAPSIINRPQLSGVHLRGGKFAGAVFTGVCMDYVDFSGADLSGADFSRMYSIRCTFNGANLTDANFHSAGVRLADFTDSILVGTDFTSAHLAAANFTGAVIEKIKLENADTGNVTGLPDDVWPMACPKEGSFVAWKKVTDRWDSTFIVKLEIPADAKRSSATGKKCRCSKAKVLYIKDDDGINVNMVVSDTYARTVYKVGEMVYPDEWNSNRWEECTHGIHFFIDKKDALNY